MEKNDWRRRGSRAAGLLAATALLLAACGPRSVTGPAPLVTRRPTAAAGAILVQPGQTLSGIAHAYHVPMHVLADANHLVPPYRIRIGQALVIPDGGEAGPPGPSVAMTEPMPMGGPTSAPYQPSPPPFQPAPPTAVPPTAAGIGAADPRSTVRRRLPRPIRRAPPRRQPALSPPASARAACEPPAAARGRGGVPQPPKLPCAPAENAPPPPAGRAPPPAASAAPPSAAPGATAAVEPPAPPRSGGSLPIGQCAQAMSWRAMVSDRTAPTTTASTSPHPAAPRCRRPTRASSPIPVTSCAAMAI